MKTEITSRRVFCPAELEAAASDKKALARVVEETGGFALVRMRALGILPPLEWLMESISCDSLSFVLDSYVLSDLQKRRIAPMLSARLSNARVAGAELSERELDDLLEDGGELMRDAVLSPRQLTLYPDQIVALAERKDYEAIGIFKRSAAALNPCELLALDRRLLCCYASSWADRSDVMALAAGKALFKTLVLERCEASGKPAGLRDFQRWPFLAEDEAFFWSLTKQGVGRGLTRTYDDLVAIPGVGKFVSKLDYARRVEPGSILAMDEEELESCIDSVRELWLDLLRSEPRSSAPTRWTCSPEQFERVVDSEWAAGALRAELDLKYGLSSDSDEGRSKAAWLRRRCLDAFCEAGQGFDLMSPSEVVRLAKEVSEERYGAVADREGDAQAVVRALERALVPYLDSFSPLAGDAFRASENWLGRFAWPALEKLCAERPCANLLALILRQAQSRESSRDRSTVAEFRALMPMARSLACRVDARSGGLLWLALAPLAERSNPPSWASGEKNSDPSGDLMGVPAESLFELAETARAVLLEFDPEFASRMERAGERPDESLLLRALALDPARPELVRALVEIDRARALGFPGFAEALRACVFGSAVADLSLIPPPQGAATRALAHFESAREAVLSAKVLERAEPAMLEREEAEEESELVVESELQMAVHARSNALMETSRAFELRARKECEGLPYEEAGAMMQAALDSGAFALFEQLRRCKSFESRAEELWCARVERMRVEEFESALVASAFGAQIASAVKYDWSCSLALDFGSAAGNARAARAAMGLFNEPERVLGLFSPEARRSFALEFAVESFPCAVLYCYHLEPQERRMNSGRYSNELVMRLFEKLEAGPGLFRSTDVNARADSFVQANFEGDSKRYLSCLEMAKSRPKLYAFLANRRLFEQFAREAFPEASAPDAEGSVPPPRMSSDMATMKFAVAKIHWPILIQGVSEILDEMRERRVEEGFSPKLAASVVESIVWCSNAQEHDDKWETICVSDLCEEHSEALLRLLACKSPLLLHAHRALGCFGDLAGAVCARIDMLAGDSVLERFFCAPLVHRPMSFSVERWGGDRSARILGAAVRWMGEAGHSEDLERLDWLVKERRFRQAEVDCETSGGCEVPGFPLCDGEILDFFASREDLLAELRVASERLMLSVHVADSGARRKAALRV